MTALVDTDLAANFAAISAAGVPDGLLDARRQWSRYGRFRPRFHEYLDCGARPSLRPRHVTMSTREVIASRRACECIESSFIPEVRYLTFCGSALRAIAAADALRAGRPDWATWFDLVVAESRLAAVLELAVRSVNAQMASAELQHCVDAVAAQAAATIEDLAGRSAAAYRRAERVVESWRTLPVDDDEWAVWRRITGSRTLSSTPRDSAYETAVVLSDGNALMDDSALRHLNERFGNRRVPQGIWAVVSAPSALLDAFATEFVHRTGTLLDDPEAELLLELFDDGDAAVGIEELLGLVAAAVT